MINFCISIVHLCFIIFLFFSIFVNICFYKLYSLIFIVFIFVHYVIKYGKCGLINIERFFLQENFRQGILFRTIKPIISYKNNIFYECGGTYILLLYIMILVIQIYKNKESCKSEIKIIFNNLYQKFFDGKIK